MNYYIFSEFISQFMHLFANSLQALTEKSLEQLNVISKSFKNIPPIDWLEEQRNHNNNYFTNKSSNYLAVVRPEIKCEKKTMPRNNNVVKLRETKKTHAHTHVDAKLPRNLYGRMLFQGGTRHEIWSEEVANRWNSEQNWPTLLSLLPKNERDQLSSRGIFVLCSDSWKGIL